MVSGTRTSDGGGNLLFRKCRWGIDRSSAHRVPRASIRMALCISFAGGDWPIVAPYLASRLSHSKSDPGRHIRTWIRNLAGGSPSRSWLELIRDRRVLALVLPRFASDPVWYFYLFWLPDYLQRNRHFSLAKVGLYGWIPFLFADLGNILGGVASDSLIRLGHPPVRSRVFILVAGACLAPLGALVGLLENVPVAFAIICLVAFLSQNWSTNSGALALDVVPVSETSSVIGLMGTAGSLGGILFSQALGLVIEHFGYSAAFIFSSALQPIAALVLVFLLKPYLPSPGRKGAAALV